MRVWLCSLITHGRHRPAFFHPTCTRCGAVVPTGITHRS